MLRVFETFRIIHVVNMLHCVGKVTSPRFATAGIRSIAAARTCKILHEVQTGSGDNSGSSPTHAGEYLPGDDAAGA